MPQNNPPFRADVVGSLLRPQVLIDARRSYRERAIGREDLVQIEDAAVREVVALQETVGLKVVTDGEFRRQNYIIDFYSRCSVAAASPSSRACSFIAMTGARSCQPNA